MFALSRLLTYKDVHHDFGWHRLVFRGGHGSSTFVKVGGNRIEGRPKTGQEIKTIRFDRADV